MTAPGQQAIVDSEVGRGDVHVGDGGPFGRGQGFDSQEVRTLAALQELLEHVLDARLHGARGEVQDADVIDVGSLAARVVQGVVGPAEHQRGKELLAVAVSGEGPGLADQRPDDMAVVDAVVLVAAQPRHRLGELAAVPDLDDVGMLADLHLAADEPRGNRVDAPAEVNRAPGTHDGGVRAVLGQPRSRQRSE